MFSKACEYGIKATVYAAQQNATAEYVSLTKISEMIDSPLPFTAKILQILVKGGILSSKKGPNGGFFIQPEVLQNLTLANIVELIDGKSIYQGCGLGLKNCDENQPCPLHKSFLHVREELKNMLETTKVESLINGLKLNETFLKN